jgi:DNA-binding MarR family transcriptional regulator
MDNLLSDFERHLKETLNITAEPKKWEDDESLPFFLRDLYAFYQVILLGTPCLLMVARDEVEQTPATIRKQLLQVQAKWNGEVIYLRSSVSAYNRKRLIEQKVPFVVPGNQMYLPMLGIDLREHFRQIRAVAPGKFSPATQAVVLQVLLHGPGHHCTPSRMAKQLGYTVMTLTRAFDELVSLGLGEVVTEGRERVLCINEDKRSLWERSREFMRSPVKRRTFIYPLRKNWGEGLPAGLTALAHFTMLAPPSNPIYAVSVDGWKSMNIPNRIEELPGPAPQSYEIEIWNYSPLLFQEDDVVDRFSLYLSLQDNTDERIQSALEKMMEDVLW